MKLQNIYLLIGFLIQGVIAYLSFDWLFLIWLFGTIAVLFEGFQKANGKQGFPWYWWFPPMWVMFIIAIGYNLVNIKNK